MISFNIMAVAPHTIWSLKQEGGHLDVGGVGSGQPAPVSGEAIVIHAPLSQGDFD